MKLVELHLLQSFPVTCLNRDDVGSPKSAFFGGVPRARVSSQCWKRAIRLYARELAEQVNLPRFRGIRSRDLTPKLLELLRPRFADPQRRESVARFLADKLAEASGKVLLFLSPKQLEEVVNQIDSRSNLEELAAEGSTSKARSKKDDFVNICEKALKGLKTPPEDAADIAIFGRMVASDPELTLEGAGLFSHALSTHEVANDIDFFSAVDDLQPQEQIGAGHMGTLEFNTACYYRYVGVNWDLLSDNLHLGCLSVNERKAVLDVFLRAAILAVPQARKNSMFGHAPPAAILGLVRDGQPLSLANAFEVPVRSQEGYLPRSQKRMEEHYLAMKKVFNLHPVRELWLILDAATPAPKVGTRADTLDQFISGLLEGISP